MRNQPHAAWQLIDNQADRREEAWNLDRQADLRIALVGLGIFVISLGIFGRLFQLKYFLPAIYLQNAHPVTIETETLPAMDGRIYSADGLLLAYDDQQFSISLHYRWLEQPPQPSWLKQQARARLNHKDWSNTEKIAAAQNEVLSEQQQLYRRLATLTGTRIEELRQRMQTTQQRIERVAETVRDRQQQRLNAQFEQQTQPIKTEFYTNWQSLWQFVLNELTQAPERVSADPIIIKEELDYHPLVNNVRPAIIAEIEAHPRDYPGVRISMASRRLYPLGNFAAHVLGNRAPLRSDQIQQRQQQLQGSDPLSYKTGDRQGQFGVERSYDTVLRGLPGERELQRNRRGEILFTKSIRKPRNGQALTLSLNSQLQQEAERLLDERISREPPLILPLPTGMKPARPDPPVAGAILVMNIYSGELLTAASAPRPDLSELNQSRADYWQKIGEDRRAPLLSRLTQATFAPGSVFKPLSAIAICETEGIPAEPFSCQGFLDQPNSLRCAIFHSTGSGHDQIHLTDALARSCNVYFFAAARRLPPLTLPAWAERFGFGHPTGVDLPFEKGGHVPSPQDNRPQSDYRWYPGDSLGLSIGQSYLQATPLQLAVMTAAIANGGELVRPRLVSGQQLSSESTSATAETEHHPRLSISAATLEIVRQGMRQTVSDPLGTGYATVNTPRIAIAGKTGTAQAGINRPDHAWFIGYVPAEQPQYAFVVFLEHGGDGGEQAGPIARVICEKMVDLQLLNP